MPIPHLRRSIGLLSMTLLVLIGIMAIVADRPAAQAAVAPNASELRFQLIGNEPIAGPDGNALVRDWSVLVFKDRRAGQCYVVFSRDRSITATPPVACPPN